MCKSLVIVHLTKLYSPHNKNQMNRPSTSINHYLDNFMPILESLGAKNPDNNLVLAGVNALKLHGLFMSREANDLDVVIFKPTKEQIDILAKMSFFQIKNPFGLNVYSEDDQSWLLNSGKQKSMKFKKNDFVIDFLLTNDSLPDNLLYYNAFGYMWKIQNVALNIEAKKSYAFNKHGDNNMALYRREKDMKDLLDLKNSNFNF